MTRTRLFWGALSIVLVCLSEMSFKLTETRWAMPYNEMVLSDGSTVGFWCEYDCSPTGIQLALSFFGLAALLFAVVTLLICIRAPWK